MLENTDTGRHWKTHTLENTDTGRHWKTDTKKHKHWKTLEDRH